ncbi:MAG: hypothetical protein IT203_11360 [Fimbriimonadaceae bacterium]|nr:hypothetical protein [Fimbriimonadaceae bacterium]
MVHLICLVATYPASLSETPEWKAFMSILNAKSHWAVLAYNKQANGKSYQFGASKSGFRFGASNLFQTSWDGKAGLELDHKAKTWRTITTLDNVDRSFEDGKPFFLRDTYGDLSKLTWTDAKGKVVKVGWNNRYVGRDDEWESTHWFDVKTHLMVEVSFSG